MVIGSIIDVGAAPPIGMILGDTGNQSIAECIGNQWGSGVVFGFNGDPFAERFHAFTDTVVNVISNTAEKIRHTTAFIMGGNKIVPIHNQRALTNVPMIMRPHILTYAPVREFYEAGRIDGWGMEPHDISTEDVAGRLINNGFAEESFNDKGEFGMHQEYLEYSWKDTDPDFTPEELDMIDSSRKFFDSFIQEQLGEDGDRVDPTNLGGYIGDEE